MLLTLFGGAKLSSEDEEPVRGRAAHRRRLALLALLAVARSKGLTRDRIVAYLWPEVDGDRGRKGLSEAIYLIRRELGEEAIVAFGEGVQLNTELVQSDVGAFLTALDEGRLEDAVAAYSAPFLDGWYVDDAAEFERWSSETRADLAGRYAAALSELAARAERRGDAAAAINWLGRLARADVHSERNTLRYAKALLAAGERAAALQALGAHEAALRRDLDIAVSDEVARFAQQLKSAASNTPIVPPRESTASSPLPEITPLRPHRKTPRPVLVAAVALGVVIFASFFAWRARTSGPSPQTALRYDPHHVAVLYFDDHTADRTLVHIADGLTEELIHQLAQVPTLRVISRNGVKRFRDEPVTPDSLAAALRAGTIVEGSVQQSRDSLRVTVQLIDGNSGLHLMSRVFARPMAELFAIEQDMATSVSVALRRHLGTAVELRTLNRGTNNTAALDLVLRARSLHDDATEIGLHPHEKDVRSAQDMLRRADSLLRRAEREDPRWNRPVIERGWGLLHGARLGALRNSDAAREAERLAAIVVRRDPQNAEALHLRGTARWRSLSENMETPADGDAGALAEADLRAALAIDSTLATAWATLADLLSVRGALAEAEAAAARALEQDAWLDGADETYFIAFAANVLLERYADARRWCLQGQLAYPQSWRFYECELTLLREYVERPVDAARAWWLVAKLDSLDPPDHAAKAGHEYSPIYRRAVAAAVSARAGESDRARRELATLRERVAGDSVMSLDILLDAAYVHYNLGEPNEARLLLEQLLAARPMLREQMQRYVFARKVMAPAELSVQ